MIIVEYAPKPYSNYAGAYINPKAPSPRAASMKSPGASHDEDFADRGR